MKKILVLFVSVATLVGLFTGCGSKPEPEPLGSGITAEEIMSNFIEQIDPAQYQLSSPRNGEYDDGKAFQTLRVTDPITDRHFYITVDYTKTGEAEHLSLRADNHFLAKLEFALFALRLYNSMGLPEIDAQAFYDHFNMLTEEPTGNMYVEGWDLWVFTTENFITLSATYEHEEASNN